MTNNDLAVRPTTGLDPANRPLLLVPLGATEQHGPHLPLDTDTRIATAWAQALAGRLGSPTLVAPALPYGSSGEHQSFPGTLSIGQTVLHSLILELVRSAAEAFRRVVLVCGHGGNAVAVAGAVRQATDEGHALSALFPHWPDDSHFVVDAHAGRTETSLMLYLAPETVRLDAAAPGNTNTLSHLLPALRSGGVAAVSANGVLGDPTGANAREGYLLFDDLVERSVARLGGL